MSGFKGRLTSTAAAVFVVGSLLMLASGAEAQTSMSPQGGTSGMPRTEADTAARGAQVSQPVMGHTGGGSAGSTSTTGTAPMGNMPMATGVSGATGMQPRGGTSGMPRTEADTAARGAQASRPIMGYSGMGDAATNANSMPSSTGGSMSSGGGSMSSHSGTSNRPVHHRRMSKRGDIMAAQQALNSNGANLKVDGKMGPNTRRALMDYQASNGLQVTGHLDSATASKLGMM